LRLIATNCAYFLSGDVLFARSDPADASFFMQTSTIQYAIAISKREMTN